MAVMLTLLYETTNNLLAPILTHSLFNMANYAFVLYQNQHPV
jgi:membrane protease YdiL (CAAX protease family)